MTCSVCVQYQLKLKDKDNHDVEQDVSTDANVVQYHIVKEGVEAWILQDFDKVVFSLVCWRLAVHYVLWIKTSIKYNTYAYMPIIVYIYTRNKA